MLLTACVYLLTMAIFSHEISSEKIHYSKVAAVIEATKTKEKEKL
jgi:hypothetical protein